MCLYPKLMDNPKYRVTKKNGGIVPTAADPRVMKVPVGCGRCMECIKQKGLQWKVRLEEEIRTTKARGAQFVTLTFSNESYASLAKHEACEGLSGYNLDNKIATVGVRYFTELWRKHHGKTVKHWLVTELGHRGTENVHLHGILWTEDVQAIKDIWKYGFVYVGKYVNTKTINYISKYVTKVDLKHSQYKPITLTSNGIGAGYTQRVDAKLNRFNEKGETKETYTTRQGKEINLPMYWRNKIYSEAEREKLWIQKLDKQIRYVCGEKIDVSTQKGVKKYYKQLDYYRRKNDRLGYGNDEKNWEKKKYEEDKRILKQRERIEKGEKNIIKRKEKENKVEIREDPWAWWHNAQERYKSKKDD